MNKNLYSKIAVNNIKKNGKFFIPRILTEMGLLANFYIVLTIALDERIREIKGGAYLPLIMMIGTAVVGFLSVILLFYTNSFIMKQRKRELGLYNVLGMEKRHVRRVLFFESFYCNLISIVLGIVTGIVLYKICSLLICRLLDAEVILGAYYISPKTIVPAILFFAVFDLIIYGFNSISIARMKLVDLLKSANTGEKEPKVKWVLLILGIICLGGGYYIALTTESPLAAISNFFIAVFLVIFGTYFLFVAGTIWVLKLLKKNKKYYYNPKHITAVSGLLYRMKQNAVGLASIAILATAVLVMISTTVSLYSGMEETIKNEYPMDYYFSCTYNTNDGVTHQVDTDVIGEMLEKVANNHDLKIDQLERQDFLEVAYINHDGVLSTDIRSEANYDNIVDVMYVTLDYYNKLTGANENLADDEIIICPIALPGSNDLAYKESISVGDMAFKINKMIQYFPISSQMSSMSKAYGIVVPSQHEMDEIFNHQKEAYGVNASEYVQRIAVRFDDRQTVLKNGAKMADEFSDDIMDYMLGMENASGECGIRSDSIWESTEYMYGLYGSLLFLGMLLGLVFLFATALIIYYKQISEGYEDRNRFQIMEKIGFSEIEVKKTIKEQILLVFFLPLLVAGVHTVVAFPILTKLLHTLLMSDTMLFAICTGIVYLLFALVYVVIYSMTARAYYKIVR